MENIAKFRITINQNSLMLKLNYRVMMFWCSLIVSIIQKSGIVKTGICLIILTMLYDYKVSDYPGHLVGVNGLIKSLNKVII